MHPTLVLGVGLCRDNMSPEHQYLSARMNLGLRECARLLGRGKAFGKGPLPTFLQQACTAASQGHPIVVALLEMGTEGGSALVKPVAELEGAIRVSTSPGRLPWTEIQAEMQRVFGDIDVGNVRVIVVGAHTEAGVLSMASYLRGAHGFDHVAVSPHLVGSTTQEAHLAVLRHTLPGLGVRVIIDLADVATFAGLDRAPLEPYEAHPCAIEPAAARDVLPDDARHIAELLCLQWTRAHLRPLMGGFSGSLLFLANGFKGGAKTEPMVLKIDAFDQMRRELRGYYMVKDFLGKHVPAFGYPVARGEWMGVGMELAAMEGKPETLQDAFEVAETETGLNRFLLRLDKALGLLSEKLYSNTREIAKVVPYRAFGMHAAIQLHFLEENSDIILGYLKEAGIPDESIDTFELVHMLRLIASNPDGLQSEVCLSHGDLNFANVICDEGDNAWFIDWTHSGKTPLELDFAKLENDVKFVMSKEFDLEDLPRLRRFETYLLEHRLPGTVESLPDTLRFAKWDLRYRKILGTVSRIRSACFALKEDDDWLVYRVALLRYATHTLSFDERRDRGECSVTQLAHALTSVDLLATDLVGDDFHLRIRSERPASYPPRQRISIDESPWLFDCPTYNPPYYVAPEILASRWADPEDVSDIAEVLASRPARYRDEQGRPRHPRGRTGIAGRGSLGLWGANKMVSAMVVRKSQAGAEILLGQRDGKAYLALPSGFLRAGEDESAGLSRVLLQEVGSNLEGLQRGAVSEGQTYDARQTDHAWVEVSGYLVSGDASQMPSVTPAGNFDELKWWPLGAKAVNRIRSAHAKVVRAALEPLQQRGVLTADDVAALRDSTG